MIETNGKSRFVKVGMLQLAQDTCPDKERRSFKMDVHIVIVNPVKLSEDIYIHNKKKVGCNRECITS